MAQVFNPSTNTIARVTIHAAILILAALSWMCVSIDRSSYNTGQGIVRPQPVPFSHAHHVAGLGLDCRYCHGTVETAAFAGMPETATCMGCHKLIWPSSPTLAPVRDSYRTGIPLAWARVNDLPDFVYFNHSIHVAKGVGCASCHGRVDRMELMWQAASLKMSWCLDCHRHPEQQIRPRDAVFDMEYEATDQDRTGPELVSEYGVRDARTLTTCSTCHR